MTIKQLRDFLNTQYQEVGTEYDNVMVVREGNDHELRPISSPVRVVDAEVTKYGEYFQYYDDENMGKMSMKTEVLLIQ